MHIQDRIHSPALDPLVVQYEIDIQIERKRWNACESRFAILVRRKQKRLPWRATEQRKVSTYETWLSEIMLQQTRVETVKSYFMAFTKKFPTIFELANASQDEVMELWAGLGYYSKARTLHACAKKSRRGI